jgi:hypothetical protein
MHFNSENTYLFCRYTVAGVCTQRAFVRVPRSSRAKGCCCQLDCHPLGTIRSFHQKFVRGLRFRPRFRSAPPSYVSSDLKDQCLFRGDEIRIAECSLPFGRQHLNMPKQAKVRKGTHSCRECRRRKVKCILAFPTDARCLPCQRRGSTCTSQSVVDSLTTTPESREYTGEFHDQRMRNTDDDRNMRSATPASALHGRVEVGEQYLSSSGTTCVNAIFTIPSSAR